MLRRVMRFALAVAVAVSALAAAITGFVWAKSYSPLTFKGGGFGPDIRAVASYVDPLGESGGKPVVFPRPMRDTSFRAGFDVYNGGRLPITILGLAPQFRPPQNVSAIRPVGLRLERSVNSYVLDDRWTEPFRPVRVPSHTLRFLVVEYRSRCRPSLMRREPLVLGRLTLRYRYLHVFERTQTVETPYVISLRCDGPIPHST